MTGVVVIAAGLCACNGKSGDDEGGGKGSGGSAASSSGGGTSGGSGARGGAAGMDGGTSSGGRGGTGGGGGGGTAGVNGGSSGTSGAAGSGPTGPCQGLRCDQTTCTMGMCTQMPCAAGTSTTVSGTVRDPGGIIPLYNVLVYVPNGTVPPLTEGVSCDRCDASVVDPVTSTRTGVDGRFVLPNAPVGTSIPLVIQVGKWRRQITLPSVPRCVDTALTDVEQTSLPSKKSEGDIPRIAIAMGGGDSMECLPRRMGVEDAEFTSDSGSGRIHLFSGTDSGQSIATKMLDSGEALPHSDTLWSSADALSRYDIVILSCEGDSIENQRPSSARQAVHDYTSMGGKVLASHWHHRWISQGPDPFPDVGTFSDRENPEDPTTATVNTTFPKGQALAEWLLNVGASTTLGQFEVLAARDNIQAVNAMHATEWARVVNANQLDTPAIQFLSFDTPLTVEQNLRCGRVVYADLEVSNAEYANMSDSPGDPFPSHCLVGDLTAQEKVAEFLLFELSSCL